MIADVKIDNGSFNPDRPPLLGVVCYPSARTWCNRLV